MNNNLQEEINRRAFERRQQGAKRLVNKILVLLDETASSGRITKTDADHVKELRGLLKQSLVPLIRNYHLFDPQASPISLPFLWHIIGLCYRAGQLTPNKFIADDLLAPEILHAAQCERGASGGKERAKKQKSATAAKHARVRRLGLEIKNRRIKNKQEALLKSALALSIAKKLPPKKKLGLRQISNILKAAKI